MHTDSGTSWWNHMCKSLKRNTAHTLKESSHLRMFL